MRRSLEYTGIYIKIGLIIMFSFILANIILIRNNNISEHIKEIQLCIQGFILISLIFLGIKSYKDKKLGYEILMKWVIVVGIGMRVGYMLYTPTTIRTHDLGTIDINSNGHMAYILNILEGHLPTSNAYQFYHPPLFHYLAAKICKLVNIFLRRENISEIVEASKIVSCFASCSMIILTKRICEELELKEKGKLIAVTLVCFIPNFYLLAGRVNNDALAIFFMFFIILYTIKWYHNPSYRNVIMLALGFGLGMMSKISVGILAFYTGSVMLYVLFKAQGIKAKKGIFLELSTFGAVCFPMALWYPIRNNRLFGQPLAYVLKISKEHPLYCGNYPWYKRFLGLPFSETYSSIYNSPYADYNVNVYLIKGALFGEFTFDIPNLISLALLLTYIVIIGVVVLSYIYLIYRYIKNKTFKDYTILVVTAILYVSHICFNIQNPFGCTMDFRYVVPIALMNALAMGEVVNDLGNYNKQIATSMRIAIYAIVVVFSVLSIVMFCNIGITSTVLGS